MTSKDYLLKFQLLLADCYLLNGCYQPKLIVRFAGLGQSAPKTLRLSSLSRLPGPLGEFNLLSVQELGHELKVSNVVFTDVQECHKCLFKKWSYLDGSTWKGFCSCPILYIYTYISLFSIKIFIDFSNKIILKFIDNFRLIRFNKI